MAEYKQINTVKSPKHKLLGQADTLREAVLISKISTIKSLAPWVIERVRPAVNLLEMLDEFEEELRLLTTHK